MPWNRMASALVVMLLLGASPALAQDDDGEACVGFRGALAAGGFITGMKAPPGPRTSSGRCATRTRTPGLRGHARPRACAAGAALLFVFDASAAIERASTRGASCGPGGCAGSVRLRFCSASLLMDGPT